MNPNLFLEDGRETIGLLAVFVKTAKTNSTAKERLALMDNAGVDLPNLQLASDPVNFANQLVAESKRFCVSERRIDYHPMLQLIEHLRAAEKQFAPYNFDDQELELFDRLLDRGRENLKALAARRCVGRIEDARECGIGTGTLIKGNLLLTCNHIIGKSGVAKAWVRFGYKFRCDGLTIASGQKFELDLENILAKSSRPDFAVLRIKEPVGLPAYDFEPSAISSGEPVRLIHHPEGKPVVVSELGRVTQVGEDYIDHSVSTLAGSSGAPILNRNWEFVAIHRGDPGVGRSVVPGTSEGLPVRTIWDRIKQYA